MQLNLPDWSLSRSRSFRPRYHNNVLVSVSVSALVSLCSGLINKPAIRKHIHIRQRCDVSDAVTMHIWVFAAADDRAINNHRSAIVISDNKVCGDIAACWRRRWQDAGCAALQALQPLRDTSRPTQAGHVLRPRSIFHAFRSPDNSRNVLHFAVYQSPFSMESTDDRQNWKCRMRVSILNFS